jgi:hypothetical protein
MKSNDIDLLEEKINQFLASNELFLVNTKIKYNMTYSPAFGMQYSVMIIY